AFLQIVGVTYFVFSMREFKQWIKTQHKWLTALIFVALLSFVSKNIAQLFSSVPYFETLAFSQKPIILAYLHLSLIGFLSFLIFFLFSALSWIRLTVVAKSGYFLFTTGFFTTELILLLSGLSIYHNHDILLFGSFSMLIGLILLLSNKSHQQYLLKQ
ncbi:MAG: hypothetical protein OIF32_09055, partial [Campylobacterales bacterium]|nr:hypothetical protein [Campylobacterales bacterium]